jgi:hypothetical protein
LTVKLILGHYPLSSIRDIDISPGWFSNGPWDAKLIRIEGRDLSLNDIEHRILRPIWKDERIHYAVNCASLGCPNLQPVAFTSMNCEDLLEKGARAYINHSRGVRREGRDLVLSKIYAWFEEDFGGSLMSILRHLRKYADPPLTEGLQGVPGDIDYQYDWRLNEAK